MVKTANIMLCIFYHNFKKIRQVPTRVVQETLEGTEPAGRGGCLWGRQAPRKSMGPGGTGQDGTILGTMCWGRRGRERERVLNVRCWEKSR